MLALTKIIKDRCWGGCPFPACLAETRLRVVGGLYVSWIFGGSVEFTLGEKIGEQKTVWSGDM